MKTITFETFDDNLSNVMEDVLGDGDIIRVDCGSSLGAFVIMEEAEYNIMRDALKTVITAATFEEPTYAAILAAAKKAGVVKSNQN